MVSVVFLFVVGELLKCYHQVCDILGCEAESELLNATVQSAGLRFRLSSFKQYLLKFRLNISRVVVLDHMY